LTLANSFTHSLTLSLSFSQSLSHCLVIRDCHFLCYSIWGFKKRIEFKDIVHYFWRRAWGLIVEVAVYFKVNPIIIQNCCLYLCFLLCVMQFGIKT
ncbi:hypothetical protein GIB67_031130, partial [Kingdonia uniflora]